MHIQVFNSSSKEREKANMAKYGTEISILTIFSAFLYGDIFMVKSRDDKDDLPAETNTAL